MVFQVKELIQMVKLLFEDLGITGFDFYDDRIEESHKSPEENRWDGCSYQCLSIKDGETVYLKYEAQRGEPEYSAVKKLKEFNSPLEGLRYLYLHELSVKIYLPVRQFTYDHKALVSEPYKKDYPNPTPKTIKKALELAGVPSSYYSLEGEEKPVSVCLKDKGADGYWLEYRNSDKQLADKTGFETELIREYNPQKKQMEQRLRPAAELWNLALEQTFCAAYKLYLWSTVTKRIKEEGKDFFKIQESDYDKYVI